MKKFLHHSSLLFKIGFLLCLCGFTTVTAQINFSQSQLDFQGLTDVSQGVTSLMYGPDGRLYVAEYPGTIKVLTIQRNGLNDYVVTDVEVLNGITNIINHDDDGTVNSSETMRETTGLTVGGTAANPVIYVASSDFRIGAGSSGNGDIGLDTNSGIITRIAWTGTTWETVDLVRGLPRSEENHATNGLELVTVNGTDYLIVAQGGHTNAGAPSKNFVYTAEYALSAAVLSVNLDMFNSIGIKTDSNGRSYIYDLPTLDDPTRANVNGITDPDTPGYDGVDINDPFGGNDGLNQAIIEASGPVQIFSPGFRNAYDLVVTESGAVYVTDNGANGGWGGFPENEGGPNVTNNYDPAEPGSLSPSGGEQINNLDHLEMVTNNIQNYTFGSFYAGHPNPVRANPNGAGLYTTPAQTGTVGAVFRTQVYDPDGSTPGSTTNPDIALPANWPPVSTANTVEGDWRGPGINNPDGPDDMELTTWGTNTNAIDEYTASNFGGIMQGNLLAGVNNGVVRRVILNPDGSLNTLEPTFLSGIGGNALGLTCNGDTAVFPGTIWAGTLNGNIVVFEPQDFVACLQPGEPGYDANADYDSDGYTNQDEIDNGTDICNGGSQPADFDKSAGVPFVSDLNDDDDDNDGIIDANDPFQLGDPTTTGSDAFPLPVLNGLFNDQQGLGGIFGLGLTGLMNNGAPNPNWLEWLDEPGQGPNPDDVLGGATGLMTSHMTSGTANGAVNTQEKGYQYGVQTDQSIGVFTVSGKILNFNGPLQLYGNSSAVGGELGFFIGDGTQSNFIKLVLTTDGITALQEINDIPQAPITVPLTVGQRPQSDVIFYFVVDAATGLVSLEYVLDEGNRQVAGSLTAQGSILQAIQQSNSDLAVGFIGTSNTDGVELEGTWDFLDVVSDIPTIEEPLENIVRVVNTADETLDLNNYFNDDNGDENLTYTIEDNTDPSVAASITNDILTLSYPGAPAVSNITIRATDSNANFIEQTFTVSVQESPVVLYRVNAGGPQLQSIDGEINWEADQTNNNSQYLVEPASNTVFTSSNMPFDGSVDASTTPTGIFATERYDNTAGGPNMSYAFPVDHQGNYEVRIYMGNSFSGTSGVGQRVFDVEIEGNVLPELNDVDLAEKFGHQVGGVISHILKVEDGTINISFVHDVIQNPLVNAIEILDVEDDETPIYLHPIADQRNNPGEQLDGSLVVSAIGGDGNLQYSATGLPPGLSIEPTNGQIGGTVDPGTAANSPYNVTITVGDSDANPNDTVTTSFQWVIIDAFSFRINAGGESVTATDVGEIWENNATEGTQNGQKYSVNTGLIPPPAGTIVYGNRDISIPAYIDQSTFDQLFEEERYDAAAAPEMVYTIPVENDTYVINIYTSNSFAGTSQAGQRIFDILIEGVIVEDNLDLIQAFGHEVAGMLSYTVQVSDGELNIAFGHEVQNPVINAIEVFRDDQTVPAFTLSPLANVNNVDGENVSFSASASGGDPSEQITYYLTGAPAGISIDLNSGLISGTIDTQASLGGPAGDGIYNVKVTVLKPGSAPQSETFTWSVGSSIFWTEKNESLNYTPRHENSFVQAGDKFYLMGGRESAQTVDIYDYSTNTWENLVDSAPFEFSHFQATEYQGLIWVIGALKTNTFPSELPAEFVWAFDPVDQVWLQGPAIPVNRQRGSAGLVLYNDKFYVIGGNTNGHNGGYVSWMDEFDPLTGTWTPLTDAPRARDHFAASLIDDKIYVAGGRLSGGTGGTFAPTIAEVDVYDLQTMTWSTLPAAQNIPTPRGGASSVNFNDKLVIIGGEVENQDVYGVNVDDALAITEQYDPLTQEWIRLPDMNFERHGTQAIVSGPGVFTLAGSPNKGGGNQQNMEYLGEDAPVGTPSVASVLNAPAVVDVPNGDSRDFEISLSDGNVGIMVSSMDISGPDAADFSITGGELQNALLKADESHTITVTLSGTGADRNAVLTINYGISSSITINLTNNNVAPVVTNPGTQNNQEGDMVSLQIEASDADQTLQYNATGLPPNLTIDPDTGLISGTIADDIAGGEAFLEENGLVVVETESGDLDPTWSITTAGGATGIIAGSNHFSAQDGGTIPYLLTIQTPGVYRFNWRNFYSGGNPSDENDNWLRFPNNSDVWFFGYNQSPVDEASLIANLQGPQNGIVFPKGSGRESANTTPEGQGSNGYFKVYRSGGSAETYTWYSKTSDNDPHDIYVYFVNPGTYTMEVSERSAGHAIDKFALYKVDGPDYSDTQLTNAPESSRAPGSEGAAANSPYTVQVSVTDAGDPPLTTMEQFIWNIGEGTGNQAPVALAEAFPQEGTAPLSVEFNGSGSSDDVGVTSYLWEFNDGTGTTSTEADPTYIFNDPGTYVVTLTVTDQEGFADSMSVTVIVNNPAGNEAPVANAEASPLSGTAPLEVSFDGSTSTDDVGVVTYAWDFGDSTTAEGVVVEHTYTTQGTYQAELTVTDAEGLTDTVIITIDVIQANQAPVAIITADPESGTVPLDVQFTGSGSTDDVAVTSYLWAFNDGSGTTSTDADPLYTFTSAGTYDVELTVEDAEGLTNSTTVTITVNAANEAPVAIASADPLSGPTPLEVQFTGSASTDDVAVTSYLWSFNDGSGTTSTDADPVYTFTTNGTFDVELTVEDAEGLTNTTTITITVSDENQAPVAIASASPLSGTAPLEVQFTGSGSTDDVAVTTYLWSFNDGSGSTATDADPVYTFNTPGTYEVELMVEDAEGLSNTTTVTIVVNAENEAPVAIVEATPVSGDAPLTVQFAGSGSTDDSGIVTYSWDFGDGTAMSDQADPTHIYEQQGTYTATLTVTDAEGLVDSASINVVVGPSDNQPPLAVIEATPLSGSSPLEVTFIGRNSIDDFGITSFSWDFGDGNLSAAIDPVHTFEEAGEYTVTLTVEDGSGLTNTTSVVITVLETDSSEMIAIVLENPTRDGVAKLRILNKPEDLMVEQIFLHDSGGRLVAVFDAQAVFNIDNSYEISVDTLRDGLYFVGLGMNEGDNLLVKLLVKN